ncbi:NUDIX hydrolase [Paenibacillus sp. GCM10023250]|uniref:NUDIX hydrolase n=1 Tax=Paenibacillus sp. GCM10023250 TaxID=3252648 RepID=UPI00360BE5EE
MRLLYRITDRDVRGGEPDLLPHVSRSASRGVLLDAEANVAMMYIAKSAIYKLPGGGIEKKETPEQAFLREVREETGYDAAIVRRLGYIEEHKKKNGFLQVSYCFVATAKEAHEARLTEHEKKLGLALKWMSMPEAIRAVDASLTATGDYSTVFMLMRDKRILEEAAKRMRITVTE